MLDGPSADLVLPPAMVAAAEPTKPKHPVIALSDCIQHVAKRHKKDEAAYDCLNTAERNMRAYLIGQKNKPGQNPNTTLVIMGAETKPGATLVEEVLTELGSLQSGEIFKQLKLKQIGDGVDHGLLQDFGSHYLLVRPTNVPGLDVAIHIGKTRLGYEDQYKDVWFYFQTSTDAQQVQKLQDALATGDNIDPMPNLSRLGAKDRLWADEEK